MNRREIEDLWRETLRSARPTPEQFDRLANGIVSVYASGDPRSARHIQNRLKQIAERTGQTFDTGGIDLVTAQTLIADEVGYGSWDDLVESVRNQTETRRPILFQYAIAAMERGDFSALETMVGGRAQFTLQIIEWFEKGYFDDELETLAEVFSASCMLGYPDAAAYLLDKEVDPLAGIKTGLNGFHYAASSGQLNVIRLLIERKVPMEVRNMYGGTVFEQALWSAINEYTPDHAAIIEALIEGGAEIDPGTLEWWQQQDVPSVDTKKRVAKALKNAQE